MTTDTTTDASPGPGSPSTRMPVLLVATAALTALADWFFYEHAIGWTLGGFAIALMVAIVSTGGEARSRVSTWCAAGVVALLGLSLIDEPGPLRIVVSIAALGVLALTVRLGWTTDPVRWASRLARLGATGWLRGPIDLVTARRWSDRSDAPPRVCTPRIGPWLAPLAMSAVFVVLFAVANPVIEGWLSSAGEWLSGAPELLDLLRMMFWSVTALGVWALLRARPIGGRARRRTAALGAPGVIVTEPRRGTGAGDAEALAAWVVRCLICFNVVFAMQSATDLLHLWGGMELPDGMHPREYARRGAYPLVATALLAAVFVLVTFRSGAVGQQWRTARVLVYVWLAQNTLLVLSAAWRLSVYIEAFQMTRLRLAAGLWMALIVFGLVTIVVRIARQRTNGWLLRANALATVALLVGACFVNFDRIIADYNVARSLAPPVEGETREKADVAYLEHLGYEALPGLHRLAGASDDTETRAWAIEAIVRLESRLDHETTDWRGWTWRRDRLITETAPTQVTQR